MTTPCVLLIQFYFYGKLTTKGTVLAVVRYYFLQKMNFVSIYISCNISS